MKKLIIHNPVNLTGNNFTVTYRGGELAKDLKRQDEVQLFDTQGQELTYANVLDIWAGPLGHYPALLAEMAHDPLCRSFTGLHTHLMLHRESDSQTTPLDTPITVLILQPKDSTIIRPSASQIAKMQGGALKK